MKLFGTKGPRLVRDPVCGQEMEFEGMKYTAQHMGRSYFFCSPHCKSSFKKQVSTKARNLTLEDKLQKKSSTSKGGSCH